MNKLIFLLSAFCALLSSDAQAQQRQLSLIVDTETTNWFKTLAEPLLEKANLDKDTVNFHLVKGKQVNAFVTPSKDIFIYTGLLMRAETAEEVQGVIAHEIGHIQAHHTLRAMQNSKEFLIPTVIGSLLGAGALVAGNAQAGTALLIGGQALTQSNILRFTRSQERQADQIATKLLHNTYHSAQGLLSFFEKMRSDQLLYSRTPPPYLLTHPLSSERVNSARNVVKNETFLEKLQQTSNKELHMIQAKLFAFTNGYGTTLRKYPGDDPASLYAQAIAYGLQGQTKISLAVVSQLIKIEPQNPFYHELKAQLYLDTTDVDQSIESFAKAVELAPHIPLLRLQYAETLSSGGKYNIALTQLNRLSEDLRESPRVLRAIGLTYGRMGNIGQSHLALAEEAIVRRNSKNAKLHLEIAKQNIGKNDKKSQQQLKNLTNRIKNHE